MIQRTRHAASARANRKSLELSFLAQDTRRLFRFLERRAHVDGTPSARTRTMRKTVEERKHHRKHLSWLALAMFALFPVGCRSDVSEGDRFAAKAVVERAIASESYDDFLSRFTPRKRERMKGSHVWIKWWQQKIGRDRASWKVAEVRGTGRGRLEVVTQHRTLKSSHQYFRLTKEGFGWMISEIETERQ